MNAVPETANPRLRPMLEEDVAQVMAVEREVYPYPWTPGIFRDCLRVGYSCWVWQRGDSVIGHGVMSIAAGEAHILNLAVRPDWQRHGLGRSMLEHLLAVAERQRVEAVFLEVRPSNRAAVNLYLRLGFEQVGIRRDYYPADGGREDALIMAYQMP